MAKVYDNSLIGKKESVIDEILLLNQHQTPLISLLGFGQSIAQTTHQWFEDEMYADESTTSASGLAADTTVSVNDGEPFRTNQVVKIGEELLLVTAVSGTSLTVTRGYASTTAADFAAGAKVEVLFVEGEEGRNARDARYKPRKKVTNLTQIFDDSIQVSGTALSVAQYGVDDIYEYEKQKKQLELALQLEKALINGIEYENGQVRQMKGVRSFVQTNVTDAGAASLSDTMVNDLAQDIYEKGGFAEGGNYKIIVPAKQKRAISGFNSADIRLERQDNGRGSVADFFVSDFGQFEIVLNNNLESNELMVVDSNRAAIRPMTDREFFHKYMGDQGDFVTGTVVGEYSLEFRQEKAHGRLKNLG